LARRDLQVHVGWGESTVQAVIKSGRLPIKDKTFHLGREGKLDRNMKEYMTTTQILRGGGYPEEGTRNTTKKDGAEWFKIGDVLPGGGSQGDGAARKKEKGGQKSGALVQYGKVGKERRRNNEERLV